MKTVYVLIQCDLGSEIDIIKEIMQISQVQEVRGTYGIHDIFCKIVADSDDTVDDIITNKIRKIPKIRTTITLRAIPFQGGK